MVPNKADIYLRHNIHNILENGTFDENPRPKYEDGTPAHSKFITHVFETYDIAKGEFPIPTLMPTAIYSGIKEILWIYKDQTSDLSVLRNKYGVKWWDLWDIGDGTIGKRYGETVQEYNLMNKLLNGIERDPFGRRHIVNLLQESDLKETAGLYPCAYQFDISIRRVLTKDSLHYKADMLLHQRSSDYITAGYINKIQYTALLMMICSHLRTRGMPLFPGKFSHMVTNLHIYDRHISEAKRILELKPKECTPQLVLMNRGDEKGLYSSYDNVYGDHLLYEMNVDFFDVIDYEAYPRAGKLDLGV